MSADTVLAVRGRGLGAVSSKCNGNGREATILAVAGCLEDDPSTPGKSQQIPQCRQHQDALSSAYSSTT